jgi:hypothetical protein
MALWRRVLTLLISNDVYRCSETVITWQGGVPPFTLMVYGTRPYLRRELLLCLELGLTRLL